MKNVYGSTRSVKERSILSSEFVTVKIGDENEVPLGQNAEVTMGRRVEPRPIFGSTDMHWVAGQQQGNANVSSLVGSQGWFAGLLGGNESECGTFKTIKLDPSKGCNDTATSSIKVDNCLLVGVGIQISAGQLSVGQNATFVCSALLV